MNRGVCSGCDSVFVNIKLSGQPSGISRLKKRMAKYTSKPTVVERPAADLAAKFADFRELQQKLDELPAEQRARIGEVAFSGDTITIITPQVGEIALKAVERSAERVVLAAEKSPVPMKLEITFKSLSADSTEMQGAIDVDIPMMLKPLIGPTLQRAADQFGELFANLA